MKSINNTEVKQIMIEILLSIDDYCKQHSLHYCLAYGTLLGAIRHNGFIPWDDDIDICMPRTDYEKFMNGFKHEYYKTISPENNKQYRLWYCKVYDSRTIIEDKFNKGIGVFVDVFPIDGLSNDKRLARAHYNKIARIRHVYDSIACAPYLSYEERQGFTNKLLLALARFTRHFVPMRIVRDHIVKEMKRFSFSDSEYVGMLCYGDSSWILDKHLFSNYTLKSFEGRDFPVPKDYHVWLTNRYGDYMTPPPKEERVGDHFINAYWR